MGGFSIWHWLVVGILVMLLFGKGRFSDMMGDVAKGIKSFKKGMAEDDEAQAPTAARDARSETNSGEVAGVRKLFAFSEKLINRRSVDEVLEAMLDDVIGRLEAKIEAAPHKEWLEYQLELKDRTSASAVLHWEKLRVSFPIEAEVDRIYRAHLTTELAKADQAPTTKDSWSTYFLAAKYFINQGGELGQASALLDKAGRIDKNFWYYEWRARLLQKQGKVQEALPLLTQAKALAAGKAPQAYIDGLDVLKGQWTKK